MIGKFIAPALALGLLAGCGGPPDGFSITEWQTVQQMSPLPPLPPDTTNKFADNESAARFGQKLFYDSRYSGALVVASDLGNVGDTGKVSCYSCHQPENHYSDGRSQPSNLGLGCNRAARNPPSLLNSAYYQWYTWAGRLDSNWAQGSASPESGDLASNRCAVAHFLYVNYKDTYNSIFTDTPLPDALNEAAPDAARFPPACKPKAAGAPDGPWEQMAAADKTAILRIMSNVGKAFAAYERHLVSGNAALDKYVAANGGAAMSASAKRGLKLFIGKAFCVQCHAGPIFTDNQFHNVGVPQTGPNVPATDTGRFDDVVKMLASPYNGIGAMSDDTAAGHAKLDGIAQQDSDKGAFRTKDLRGCANSAPYEHDGVFATLRDVIDFYDKGGGDTGFVGTKDEKLKPLNLTDGEKDDLVAFLQALTGDDPPADWGKPQ